MITRRERLLNTKNYILYYGTGKSEKLSEYDLAVVESDGQSADNVKKLHESGVLVVSYLSVMEIHPTSPLFTLLKDEDFLKVNNTPLVNSTYGTYLVDLRSRRWERMILHSAGRLLLQLEYDGIFLDTIGNVESNEIPKDLQNAQILAAVELVQKLRDQFKEHILIQNNGLEKLCLYTSGYLDGICWENPPIGKAESELWLRQVVERLTELKLKHKTSILLLLEEDPGIPTEESDSIFNSASGLASKNDFLLYRAPYRYTGIITP